MRPATLFSLALLAFCCDVINAAAAPTYEITALGFDDVEHTDNTGARRSNAFDLNEAGQVIGLSSRYDGSSTYLGESAWLYDGVTTIGIGLTGAEHTSSDGYKDAGALKLNQAGQASGVSTRFNGGSAVLGESAWLYDGVTTFDIGLTGVEHTRSDDFKFGEVLQMNNAGQVRGSSQRYNGGISNVGESAWLYDGMTTIDIGLTGAGYTLGNGYSVSFSVELNEAGQVIGNSSRFNDSSDLGQSAWLYDGVTTSSIGPTGAQYTRSDGYEYGASFGLNEAGQAIGYSNRYNGGSNELGRTAWLYDGVTTIEIGLTGAEHTRNDGYRRSAPSQLNETGQVGGYSYRYNGGNNELGRTAWLYDGLTTIEIGFTGAEHTRNDGYKQSEPRQLNNAGQTTGQSTRYNGGSKDLGTTAWLYDGVTTIDVGLTGAEHTRNDGYKRSDVSQLNEAGRVGGYSYRYNGGSAQLGQDAWFYDPALDQTFSLQLSQRSDGYAYSSVSYLGEDGLVLGSYSLFDGLENNLGDRAFSFTVADGLHDLGPFVDGGLAAQGWEYLASAIRANSLGQITGRGELSTQPGSQIAYLLTPVPEPSALLLALLATLVSITHRRP